MSPATVMSIPELLIDIFTHLADVWPAPDVLLYRRRCSDGTDQRSSPELDPVKCGSPIMGWVNITFVCAQWRRVAISTDILWADISGGLSGPWIDLFVERSGSALLTLGNRDRTDPTPIHYESQPVAEPNHIFRIMPAVWPRVRYLHLTHTESRLPDVILRCLSHPTYNLRRCELWNSSLITDVDPEGRFFAGEAPRLRHFFCNRPFITFPWNASFVYQLHSLVISYGAVSPTTMSKSFYTILSSLQSIRWLDLRDLWRLSLPDSIDSPPDFPPINLPHIEKLGLHGCGDTVAFVFKHLNVPEAASVELRCHDEWLTENHQHLFPAVHSRYENRTCTNMAPIALYLNLEVGTLRVTHLVISAWSSSTGGGSLCSPGLERDFNDGYNTRPSSQLIDFTTRNQNLVLQSVMSDILPFSRATILHTPRKTLCTASALAEIFWSTTQIETLCIGRMVRDELHHCRDKLHAPLDALLDSTRRVVFAGQPLTDLLLPRLHTIHVGLDLPGTWHTGEGSESLDVFRASSTVAAMEKLRQLVLKRAAVGAPLRAIHIVGSSLQAKTPELLPTVIPNDIRDLVLIH